MAVTGQGQSLLLLSRAAKVCSIVALRVRVSMTVNPLIMSAVIKSTALTIINTCCKYRLILNKAATAWD